MGFIRKSQDVIRGQHPLSSEEKVCYRFMCSHCNKTNDIMFSYDERGVEIEHLGAVDPQFPGYIMSRIVPKINKGLRKHGMQLVSEEI